MITGEWDDWLCVWGKEERREEKDIKRWERKTKNAFRIGRKDLSLNWMNVKWADDTPHKENTSATIS